MDLISRFLPIQKCRQYVFVGEGYADIFPPPEEPGKTIRRRKTVPLHPGGITSDDFGRIRRELASVDTGVILHPGFFIYNIFEFDRIPFPEKLRRELICWKLEKVFPEDIGSYHHQFFKLDSRRIFSILIRKSMIEAITSAARSNGITLGYIGNSTVEIINHLFRSKAGPDFFIEITGTEGAIVFKQRDVPVYVRKFRSDSTEDLIAEIEKTVQFVRSHFSLHPAEYRIIAYREDIPVGEIEPALLGSGLTKQQTPKGEFPYLPVD